MLPVELINIIIDYKYELEYEDRTDQHWKKFQHTLNVIKYFNHDIYHYHFRWSNIELIKYANKL